MVDHDGEVDGPWMVRRVWRTSQQHVPCQRRHAVDLYWTEQVRLWYQLGLGEV
jgi:hypothetical protein